MAKTSWLGPMSVVGFLLLGFLDRGSLAWESDLRLVAGAALFVPGAAAAVWGAVGLGFKASTGVAGELMANGAYRFSRNPQYVGSIGAMGGYALLCNSWLALAVWAFWSLWFVLAPFAEEPWLREKLGPAYDAYAQQVRRYL